MSRSGREAISDVREWSEMTPGCPGEVVRPSRCLGVVGSPSQMSGCGREALPDVQEWSGGPRRFTGVVGRPSRMSGSGWEAPPVVRE